MSHDNVVELYNYTETEDEFLLFMEYCDRGAYLSDRIHSVIDFLCIILFK